jgi:hypothetical protein
MDVIDFPYVTLGSSTVHLRDSEGRRRVCACSVAGFSTQNCDFAWGVYYQRAAFRRALFCGPKDLKQRIFINKCFLFTVGSVCRVKRFTTMSVFFQLRISQVLRFISICDLLTDSPSCQHWNSEKELATYSYILPVRNNKTKNSLSWPGEWVILCRCPLSAKICKFVPVLNSLAARHEDVQSGSVASPFLTSALVEVSCQLHAPAALPPGKETPSCCCPCA